MGGNALLSIGVETKRINSREEFFYIQSLALELLKNYYNIVVPCLETVWKTSFGDIDILVSDQKKPLDMANRYKNGYITSFEFMNIQVDAIEIHRDTIDIAKVVLFDDMGACMGQFTKHIGIKLTDTGLYTKQYDFLLSTNPIDIFRFLGYTKPFPFNANTNIEFFEWLLSGKYNIKDCFGKIEKSSSFKNKRKTFIEFIDYTRKKDLSEYKYEKLPTLLEAIDFFGKTSEYLQMMAKIEKEASIAKLYREKCGGNYISMRTRLVDVELGKFIKCLLEKKSKESVVSMDQNEIDNWIDSEFQKFSNI
jgi:hypothetical protein